MCWQEKDHTHTCPYCVKDFDVEGSGDAYEAVHYSIEKCPHCGKPFKWDEDGGDPQREEEADEAQEEPKKELVEV
jgi:endogenous inhibitor of DNA gyrase (YacG/DUF329 family)